MGANGAPACIRGKRMMSYPPRFAGALGEAISNIRGAGTAAGARSRYSAWQ
jgi:hypothetical protein